MICYCEVGIKNRGRKKIKIFHRKNEKVGKNFPHLLYNLATKSTDIFNFISKEVKDTYITLREI